MFGDKDMSEHGKSIEQYSRYSVALNRTIQQHQLGLSRSSPSTRNIFHESDKRQCAVHLRVRPLSSLEQQQPHLVTAIHCSPTETVLYYPFFRIVTDPSLDIHSFSFDGNHGPTTHNDCVYKDAVDGVMDFILRDQLGGLVTVFAYGQTGSGKTYTMSYLADRITQDLPFNTHSISICMLEILGDAVSDLLYDPSDTSPSLVRVLANAKGSVVVSGASEVSVINSTEAQLAITAGFNARSSSATFKNDSSSRSHLVCHIRLVDRVSGVSSGIKLVDLAGSERAADTNHHSVDRIKESALINTSLMALKECLRKRSSGDSAAYIPFRNSKLTLLLKDSLDLSHTQPTKTIMIACVAPTIADISHSLNTFRYASTLTTDSNESTQGSHLKPKKSALVPPPSAKSKPTPMAWSVSKLDQWLSTKSKNGATLPELLGKDGDTRLASVGKFIPPPWKFIYDLTPEQWVKRLSARMDAKEVDTLRKAYRMLFVQARAKDPGNPVDSSTVQSILLVEDTAMDAMGVGKENATPAVSSLEKRRLLAMEKLKAKGNAAREKANDALDTRVHGTRSTIKSKKTSALATKSTMTTRSSKPA
ncbi:hypothetical protein O5D80_008080 [Batrachochytrium dendrobatidis]|nr:hypothetical protein O5D80_008080 [Batrachochytrium dendrobatidis]